MPTRAVKTPASGPTPSAQALEQILQAEGLDPLWWSNGPAELYAPHEHPYHKVLYCHSGSIVFLLPSTGEAIELHAGDRLDLPPGTRHGARVGSNGVRCVEAWRGV